MFKAFALTGRLFKIRIKIWYEKWCYIGVSKLLIFNTLIYKKFFKKLHNSLIFSIFANENKYIRYEKSTKDVEFEKLQKRVEKLVKANKSLKKDKRNLKRRLTTSQNKSNKYRSELKKKEKPNVGLDKESFEQIMSLLDDIIIHP